MSLCFTFVSYYILHYRDKTNLATYIIMSIAIIPLYLLIYFNHFENMVIVYVLLLPIASFFLLDFKKAMIANALIYLLLILMLYYIFMVNPEASILSNSKALINIAFASMFIVFFGIFYHLAVESSLKAMIKSNRQKDMLLKEVHHRVKNNLNITASMLGLQAMNDIPEVKKQLLKSKKRIETISAVYEMLYAQDDCEKINFHDYTLSLFQMYDSQNNCILELDMDKNLTLYLDKMVQFGLMINEMMTNTIKYAKNDEQLRIKIMLSLNENQYTFKYQDNGKVRINIDELFDSKGLGMNLIDISVKQLDGNLKCNYSDGLCYEVRFYDA
ncbi:MAG: sensor histidine kinase [Campylobacterota bacterium]|nr:sensor histidine kinase [Campylobacterota bacterium]